MNIWGISNNRSSLYNRGGCIRSWHQWWCGVHSCLLPPPIAGEVECSKVGNRCKGRVGFYLECKPSAMCLSHSSCSKQPCCSRWYVKTGIMYIICTVPRDYEVMSYVPLGTQEGTYLSEREFTEGPLTTEEVYIYCPDRTWPGLPIYCWSDVQRDPTFYAYRPLFQHTNPHLFLVAIIYINLRDLPL